jgi:rubrerythrin
MKQWSSAEDVFDFAIQSEIEAARFYRDLATKVTSPGIKELFMQFAQEEEGHKAKLEHAKKTGEFPEATAKVRDLKIGDYMIEPTVDANLDYQQALVLAMKREKVAFRLYSDMAEATSDERLRNLLLTLALEEAKHKLRFEVEYDRKYLTEN